MKALIFFKPCPARIAIGKVHLEECPLLVREFSGEE
jgi:hypothetical protein